MLRLRSRKWANLPPPIILIGMHRAGTSLMAAMCQVLGVYVGPGLNALAAGGSAGAAGSLPGSRVLL